MRLEVASAVLAVLTGAVGLLAVAASLLGWDWFFNSASARALTGRMSRRTTRCLYFILGMAIVAMALFIAKTSLS